MRQKFQQATWPLNSEIKMDEMAAHNIKTDSGCSLGIRDQRILHLLHKILRPMLGSL